MLIGLEGARKVMPVHAAVAAAREAGRKYISVASEILGKQRLEAGHARGPKFQSARASCSCESEIRQSRKRTWNSD